MTKRIYTHTQQVVFLFKACFFVLFCCLVRDFKEHLMWNYKRNNSNKNKTSRVSKRKTTEHTQAKKEQRKPNTNNKHHKQCFLIDVLFRLYFCWLVRVSEETLTCKYKQNNNNNKTKRNDKRKNNRNIHQQKHKAKPTTNTTSNVFYVLVSCFSFLLFLIVVFCFGGGRGV